MKLFDERFRNDPPNYAVQSGLAFAIAVAIVATSGMAAANCKLPPAAGNTLA